MLVLSRFVGERVNVRCGEHEIVVQIVDARLHHDGRRKVRLAFDAPPSVTIYREELQKKIDNGEWDGTSGA